MLTKSQDHSLRVIAASLIQIAGYMKLQARAKLSHDEMGFFNNQWNREVRDSLDEYMNQLPEEEDA